MWEGKVLAIHVRARRTEPITAVESALLTPGRGVQGDHAAEGDEPPESRRQITLIESEALEGAEKEYGVAISHAESRRNVLTLGVPLNHLVDAEFLVGECTLRGVELCEPCGYLEKLTGKSVIKVLRHRGGLRAVVVQGGQIRPGDSVSPVNE